MKLHPIATTRSYISRDAFDFGIVDAVAESEVIAAAMEYVVPPVELPI